MCSSKRDLPIAGIFTIGLPISGIWMPTFSYRIVDAEVFVSILGKVT